MKLGTTVIDRNRPSNQIGPTIRVSGADCHGSAQKHRIGLHLIAGQDLATEAVRLLQPPARPQLVRNCRGLAEIHALVRRGRPHPGHGNRCPSERARRGFRWWALHAQKLSVLLIRDFPFGPSNNFTLGVHADQANPRSYGVCVDRRQGCRARQRSFRAATSMGLVCAGCTLSRLQWSVRTIWPPSRSCESSLDSRPT